ncbi:hypothetical protein [Janthinobacterium sp. NKUCC06_STL]|uniref:hypothetical protein n=1 Tax=Janthinobacterium sp. NKUCC06_STL TaxID=2842127 RepID=UPI001C5B83CE|nr:hypothetical protein [Janthinobacterium sp. NKUCC06_STL]MBW3509086.1 hypothetical protein [Janthinobacterium sp. NKUCC06_STL]
MGDYSHSIVNKLAKRLIFQYFPNHSGTDTLKNTFTCKIRYCRFVATGMGYTSPLTRTCHQILLGDNAFISAHQQSQRSDAFKDTPRQQRRAVTLSLAQYQARYSNRNETMARLSVYRVCHILHHCRFSRLGQDSQSSRIGI